MSTTSRLSHDEAERLRRSVAKVREILATLEPDQSKRLTVLVHVAAEELAKTDLDLTGKLASLKIFLNGTQEVTFMTLAFDMMESGS